MDKEVSRVNGPTQALDPSKGGRPTKLTPAVQNRIIAAIKAGHFRESAARLGGISAPTLYRWLSADEEPYLGFQMAIETAEAELEEAVLEVVTNRIPEDARLALTFLAKRFPERWGSRGSSVTDDGRPVEASDASVSHLNVLVINQRHLDEAAEQHLDSHRTRLAAHTSPETQARGTEAMRGHRDERV